MASDFTIERVLISLRNEFVSESNNCLKGEFVNPIVRMKREKQQVLILVLPPEAWMFLIIILMLQILYKM